MKKDFSWLHHPSVIILLGETGSGKSATAHYILESRFHAKGVKCSMVAPQKVKKLVPDWLVVHGRQLPADSAILVDDAQLTSHSREFWKNVSLDKLLSMSRHKGSTIIFSTQVAAIVDVNVIRRSDTVIFKQPPLMAEYVERREMKKLVELADKNFDALESSEPEANLQQYSYVISNKPRFVGMVGPTGLSSYWSEELSRW